MNEQSPLVSIIVPVYNTEKYLSSCINSLLNQTYHNLEIILVDDGSTDDSGEICDTYAQKESRVKVIHQENKGVSSARNAGLSIAQGDFFAFVDSDDVCQKNMYCTMVEIALSKDVPLVLCSGYYFSEQGEKNITSCEDDTIKIISSYEMIETILWSNDGNTMLFTMPVNKLFRSCVFKDILIFNENVATHEDEYLMTYIYLEKYDIAIIERPFYGYRENVDSITHGEFSEDDCVMLDILFQRCILYNEKGLLSAAHKAAKNFCEIYIAYFYKAQNKGHVNWVSKYKQNFHEMRAYLGLKLSLKHQIRYSIFNISPAFYNRFVLNH